jgi:hypothetical protein
MPSTIPSYIYTLFASIIVGTLIITTCALATLNVKAEAENQQLSNITDYVATKSMDLISGAPADNLDSKLLLDIPSLIGNQRYWIQIQNDSSSAWVTAGFGEMALQSAQKSYIQSDVVASGFYISGSGPVFIEYQTNSTGSYLTLNGGN